MEKIIKEYFQLYTQMSKEKQFNRKVELNSQVKRFKDRNKIVIVSTSTKDNNILLNGEHVATMVMKYSKKKINLEYKELGYKLVFVEEKS